MDISVIICTYNGSRTIIRCLEALAEQKTELDFEVIVVDNKSSDNTFSLVDNYAKSKKNTNIKLFCEENAGKVNALKKGVAISSGELVIICDDDNYLNEDFIDVAHDFFKNNPQCGAACGGNFAISDVDFPVWFKEYEVFYACGALLDNTGELNNLWGAGMVIRGDLMRRIYSSGLVHLMQFVYDSENRFKGIRVGGEDNELCFWTRLFGYKLYFINELKLKHHIDSQRLTINYRENLLEGIKMTNELFKRKTGILRAALKKVRKKDYVNIFLLNDTGVISRLKLGIIRNGDLYNNYQILKALTS